MHDLLWIIGALAYPMIGGIVLGVMDVKMKGGLTRWYDDAPNGMCQALVYWLWPAVVMLYFYMRRHDKIHN